MAIGGANFEKKIAKEKTLQKDEGGEKSEQELFLNFSKYISSQIITFCS